jgi:hypothetical protein
MRVLRFGGRVRRSGAVVWLIMVGVIVVSVGRGRGWRTAAFDTDYTYEAEGASAESDELQIFGGEPQFLALNRVLALPTLG